MKNQKNEHDRIREPLHRAHRNFFVGLFVLIPLLLVPTFIIITFAKLEFFKEWKSFMIRYENIYGLQSGDDVTISGKLVGHVGTVTLLENGKVDVEIKVIKDKSSLVRYDTKALLQQKNMVVGDWEIKLTLGDGAAGPAPENHFLTPELPLRIDRVIEQVTSMMISFEVILKEIAQGEGLIGYLLREDTLITAFHKTIADFNTLVTNANTIVSEGDKVFKSFTALGKSGSSVLDSLSLVIGESKPVIEEVKNVVEKIDSSSGQLPNILGKVNGSLDNLDTLLKTLNEHRLLRRPMKRVRESQGKK